MPSQKPLALCQAVSKYTESVITAWKKTDMKSNEVEPWLQSHLLGIHNYESCLIYNIQALMQDLMPWGGEGAEYHSPACHCQLAQQDGLAHHLMEKVLTAADLTRAEYASLVMQRVHLWKYLTCITMLQLCPQWTAYVSRSEYRNRLKSSCISQSQNSAPNFPSSRLNTPLREGKLIKTLSSQE